MHQLLPDSQSINNKKKLAALQNSKTPCAVYRIQLQGTYRTPLTHPYSPGVCILQAKLRTHGMTASQFGTEEAPEIKIGVLFLFYCLCARKAKMLQRYFEMVGSHRTMFQSQRSEKSLWNGWPFDVTFTKPFYFQYPLVFYKPIKLAE